MPVATWSTNAMNVALPNTYHHPDRGLRQRLGRRAGSDGPVAIVHTAVARTEKQLRLRHPADRAAEVGAVHREGGELLGVVTAKPRGRASSHAGPGQW